MAILRKWKEVFLQQMQRTNNLKKTVDKQGFIAYNHSCAEMLV